MNSEETVAAILTAGMLMRMPTSGVSGSPERDRALRATEAVESYFAVLKALRVARQARSPQAESSPDR